MRGIDLHNRLHIVLHVYKLREKRLRELMDGWSSKWPQITKCFQTNIITIWYALNNSIIRAQTSDKLLSVNGLCLDFLIYDVLKVWIWQHVYFYRKIFRIIASVPNGWMIVFGGFLLSVHHMLPEQLKQQQCGLLHSLQDKGNVIIGPFRHSAVHRGKDEHAIIVSCPDMRCRRGPLGFFQGWKLARWRQISYP